MAMIERVQEWGLTNQVAEADAGYGSVCEFCDELTAQQLRYIVGVGLETGVWLPSMTVAHREHR